MSSDIMLQVNNSTATDALLNGDVFNAVVSSYSAVVPLPIVALLVFAPIGLGFYMTQRSALVPFIMFVLIGSVTVSEMPQAYQSGVLAVFIVAIAGIGYVLLQRVSVT
jgi:hypothetical protein